MHHKDREHAIAPAGVSCDCTKEHGKQEDNHIHLQAAQCQYNSSAVPYGLLHKHQATPCCHLCPPRPLGDLL
jgi:hypothetical protein